MSREPRHRATDRDARSWQRAVLARIGLAGLRRTPSQRGDTSHKVIPGGGDMQDKGNRTPIALLERPRRLWPSWRRRLARVAVIAVGLALVAQSVDYALDRGPDCAAAIRTKSWASAVQICQRELERTQDPATGVHLADAQVRTGDAAAATRTASRLLRTSAHSDALYVLGWIARSDDRTDAAIAALEPARGAHRAERRSKELAKDVALLAMIRADRGEFAESLRLADECITRAHMTPDPDLWSYCHLIAAKSLALVGYWSAADVELEIAMQFATSASLRSDVAYHRGSCAQEAGDQASAIAWYQTALRLHGSPGDPIWSINTELSLAYALGERHDPDEAQRHLQNATWIDTEGKKAPERAWVGAQLAYRQHDLARATALTDRYVQLRSTGGASGQDDPTDRDDRIDVLTLRARIELERGDLASAERWARQGVEQAEHVRGTQSALELRPWVLAKRRGPYELLFTALARSGQVDAAAMVFDDWQGRTVQDALATPRPPTALDHRGAADQVTQLGNWQRVSSPGTFARRADRAAVLSTLRGIDLLALIVADGEVWRLTASHGPPRLDRVVSLSKIEKSLGDFRTHPTDAVLAAELGALLVPENAFHTSRILHVLVDGRLGSLPAAALRHGDTVLIAVRPIAHVLRLPELRCVPSARPGHATVLGALGAGLLNAPAEANEVAELLHATSATGADATRAALFAAANDAVLHVAAHGDVRLDGAALLLADGEVSALEISVRRVAPALAVLSACDAATSDDIELGGSLVAGFLGAGSVHVVATLRPISDAGAPDIMTRFYRAGGVADPARALAIVQAELATTGNVEWPYFAAFGPDVCRDGALDHQ